jgi:hypothetical protein
MTVVVVVGHAMVTWIEGGGDGTEESSESPRIALRETNSTNSPVVRLPTDEDSGDYECYCDIVAAAPRATPSLNGANPPQFAIVVAPCRNIL